MTSRSLCVLIIAAVIIGLPANAKAQQVEVFKSESCGCCSLWIEHMRRNGFDVIGKNKALGQLARIKLAAGLKPPLHSCHTAKVGDDVIEGHVPAADVRRVLAERPDAIGLSVPGMPLGSPGMEAGDRREPYEVLLVKRDGSTEIFARR